MKYEIRGARPCMTDHKYIYTPTTALSSSHKLSADEVEFIWNNKSSIGLSQKLYKIPAKVLLDSTETYLVQSDKPHVYIHPSQLYLAVTNWYFDELGYIEKEILFWTL